MSTAASRPSRSHGRGRPGCWRRNGGCRKTLAVERAASDGYDAWRAARVAGGVKGNRVGGPTKPYEPPEEPAGKINVTDPDSRNVKTSARLGAGL